MNVKELSSLTSALQERELCIYKPSTVVEMSKEYARNNSDLVTYHNIGKSQEGRELPASVIGKGEKVILALANAHAEEPIGTVSLDYLKRELVENKSLRPILDEYKFVFIEQINPDGCLKNWEWIKKPFSFYDFNLHHFREDMVEGEDIEWGFPKEKSEAVRPEVNAIVNFLQDYTSIDYFVSLHSNWEYSGGVLYLLLAEDEKFRNLTMDFLAEETKQFSVPLVDSKIAHLGGYIRYREGFFGIPSLQDLRKIAEESGNPDYFKKTKPNSIMYIQDNFGSKFSMVSELPFVYDLELSDMTDTDHDLGDVLKSQHDRAIIKFKEFETVMKQAANMELGEKGRFWFERYQRELSRFDTMIGMSLRKIDNIRGEKATLGDLKLDKIKECNLGLPAKVIKLLRDSKDKNAQVMLKKYNAKYSEAFDQLEKIANFVPLSLFHQARMQSTMVLAGTLL